MTDQDIAEYTILVELDRWQRIADLQRKGRETLADECYPFDLSDELEYLNNRITQLERLDGIGLYD